MGTRKELLSPELHSRTLQVILCRLAATDGLDSVLYGLPIEACGNRLPGQLLA